MPIYLPPIPRRSFLKGALAAGAAALLGREALAEAPKKDPNRWALISDIHVSSRREDKHADVKPAETFAATVKQVLALDPLPATAIITGDLAALTGEPGDYKLVKELFLPLRAAGIPLHLVLGNHDHREHFWAAFPEAKPAGTVADRQTAIVETPLANWFLMDSLLATKLSPGALGKEQLAWLAKELDARKDKPALLVAHHQLDLYGGLLDYFALLERRRPAASGEGLFPRPHALLEGRPAEGNPHHQRARHGLAL